MSKPILGSKIDRPFSEKGSIDPTPKTQFDPLGKKLDKRILDLRTAVHPYGLFIALRMASKRSWVHLVFEETAPTRAW
jgi:hypothetical protein